MSSVDFSGLRVVTVNWNHPGDTIECVQSLLKSGLPASQILVVDNGSQDGSPEQLRKALAGIELHELPTNQGFTGGNNYGIDVALNADATQVLLLNNDTVIAPETLSLLMNAPWDISVPIIYFYDQPRVIWSAGAYWRSFPPMVIMRGYRKREDQRYTKPMELEYATACALMVRRHVFEKVGSFDFDFENYFEDYDFAYRVRKAGFTIGYVPQARVWHKVSRTLGADSPQRVWYQGRNSVLFYRKDRRLPVWALYAYLGWVNLREMIKLNFTYLPNFWRGVRAGFEWVRDGNHQM